MLNFLNKLKFGLFYKIIYIYIYIYKINESIEDGDNKNDINELKKKLCCCSSGNHPHKKKTIFWL
jgi:hypothetical protein